MADRARDDDTDLHAINTARTSGALIRKAAVAMVNQLIVLHEKRGLDIVELDSLRTLAEHINAIALLGDMVQPKVPS